MGTSNNPFRVGVDMGGTKIEAIVLNAAGEVLARERFPTPKNYDETLIATRDLVLQVEQQAGRTGTVGIGTPGAISPATGMMKNANNTALNGKPLDKDLEVVFKRPIRIANDANCFALSEAVDGAAAGAEIVFGVIVGTGCGGGVVINQRVLRGVNAISGEWGHNPLPHPRPEELPGPKCYCGHHGCVETWISGTGLQDDYLRESGIARSGQEIAQLAEEGEEHANRVLANYEDRMARSLATMINILDPDVVVLGGGASNIDRLYHNVPALWTKYIFSDNVDTRLVKAKYGDSSGVRGAAWLWPLESD